MDRGTVRELTNATDEELIALVLRRQEAGGLHGLHGGPAVPVPALPPAPEVD